MTTRVGVNLLWMVPGEVGGSESWVTGLLRAVAADPPPDLTVVVFAAAAVLDAYPWLGDSFEVVRVPAPVGPSRPLRVAAESSWLAGAARRAGVDVLHHMGGTIPPIRATASMVTIHDLQPLTVPANFSRVKRTYLQARLRPSVRRARVVSAVSAFTAADVVDRLGADPDRVMVTPPAVDPEPAPPAIDAETVGAAYRLTPRWFLFPAITYPHKNHAVLLHAMAELARTHDDVSLVLTGGAGSEEDRLRLLAERLGVAERLRRPGRVPADHLDRLYRGAVACTFPSTYEAVGLPVLEAMARSCPVVASDTPGVAEAVGGAGVLVAADDPGAWAEAMRRTLDDEAHRATLIDAGRRRVQAWAPPASAARLVEAWRRGGGAR